MQTFELQRKSKILKNKIWHSKIKAEKLKWVGAKDMWNGKILVKLNLKERWMNDKESRFTLIIPR